LIGLVVQTVQTVIETEEAQDMEAKDGTLTMEMVTTTMEMVTTAAIQIDADLTENMADFQDLEVEEEMEID
jgi:hypothetical protein